MTNLIILDIDNTLIDSERNGKKKISRPPNSIFFGIKNYSRPHLIKFIKECFKQFTYVALWTAATKDWANNFIYNILKMKRTDFLFVWDITKCSVSHTLYCKPLNKVWKQYKQLNNTNTLIVDDRIYNGIYNKRNFLQIPSYNIHHNDNTLLQLIVYLKLYDWKNIDVRVLLRNIKLYKYLK